MLTNPSSSFDDLRRDTHFDIVVDLVPRADTGNDDRVDVAGRYQEVIAFHEVALYVKGDEANPRRSERKSECKRK
jgi:hypothetical protein